MKGEITMECVEKLFREIRRRGEGAKPATEEQMVQLQQFAGEKKLPQAYLEFMREMGNELYNSFMVGESCFMNEIFDLKEGALELLEENESKLTLTDDDFVFWMSQGYMFGFFKLNEGDNPPVYFYSEDREDRYIKIAHSLTDFYWSYLTDDPNFLQPK